MSYKYEDERARGCLVHKIDNKALGEHIRKIMALQYGPETDVSSFYVTNDLVLGRDKKAPDKDFDRDTVIICVEGVGWSVKEFSTVISVPVSSPNSYYSHPVYISPSLLWTFATGEVVDLADSIRTFGSRLESNFWLWYNLIQGKGAKAHA